ncbi:MAG TPA: hypothetical protein VFW07_07685 [Parafilimonas sp.]|nr:hypothetical protein [Parafilimonas sp.]
MKKFLLIILALLSIQSLKAQYDDYSDDNGNGGFKKENVFLGGALSLGFGSGSFAIGGNPEIGYSFNKWFDAGLIFNINYFSQTDYYNNDIKYSNFNYGGGIFLRGYPVPFLFLQIQPEHNWITYTNKYNDQVDKATYSANSLIGAIGYGQRIVGRGSYFFLIGLDLLTETYSPYLDGYGHPYPIIRGGFDIYLKPSRKSKPAGPVL